MVQEYLKLPPDPPSPVLPSEHPQQEVRGPAGGGEVGSQWDNPTQQQVLTGGPAGWDPPQNQFSSTDIRERTSSVSIQEQMSAHTIVVHFNKYCHQKPAGNYRLPEFSSSSLQSSCLLCNLGNTCLSTYCNVKEPTSKKKNKPMSSTVYSLVIPGLPDDSNSIPTVLTNPTFTKTKKIKVFPIFSTKSSIFHPPSKPKSTAKVSISTATQKAPKVRNKMTKKSETPSWYDKSLKRKLLGILLKTSLKSTKRRKQSSPNKNKNGSTTRKLETSEIMCPKLLSKNPSSSSSTADSSSGSTNISSSSNDSSFLSLSSSSNFNYTEIIDYLQTEWDTSKDLFDEENNPSLPSPEKLRMPSSTKNTETESKS